MNSQRITGNSTPLIIACSMGNIEIVKLLINNKADTEITNCADCTALIEAVFTIREYDPDSLLTYNIIKLLLDGPVGTIGHGADINKRSMYGETPLNRAAAYGNYTITKLFLDRGVKISTPLHALERVGYNYKDIVELLLKAGLDIDKRDTNNKTALMRAVLRRNYDLAKLLIRLNADINIRDDCHRKVIDYVDDIEFVKFLLDPY